MNVNRASCTGTGVPRVPLLRVLPLAHTVHDEELGSDHRPVAQGVQLVALAVLNWPAAQSAQLLPSAGKYFPALQADASGLAMQSPTSVDPADAVVGLSAPHALHDAAPVSS